MRFSSIAIAVLTALFACHSHACHHHQVNMDHIAILPPTVKCAAGDVNHAIGRGNNYSTSNRFLADTEVSEIILHYASTQQIYSVGNDSNSFQPFLSFNNNSKFQLMRTASKRLDMMVRMRSTTK